jgi:hypothetical protein
VTTAAAPASGGAGATTTAEVAVPAVQAAADSGALTSPRAAVSVAERPTTTSAGQIQAQGEVRSSMTSNVGGKGTAATARSDAPKTNALKDSQGDANALKANALGANALKANDSTGTTAAPSVGETGSQAGSRGR